MNDTDHIILLTANAMGCTPKLIQGRRKAPEITQARAIAAYAVRSLTRLKLEYIGECFGGRNHTSALKLIEKGRQHLTQSQQLRDTLKTITEKFQTREITTP